MTDSRIGGRIQAMSALALLGVLAVVLSACAVYVPEPGYWGHGYHDDHG